MVPVIIKPNDFYALFFQCYVNCYYYSVSAKNYYQYAIWLEKNNTLKMA